MKNNKKQLRTGVSILILVFVFSAFSGELYAKKSKNSISLILKILTMKKYYKPLHQ